MGDRAFFGFGFVVKSLSDRLCMISLMARKTTAMHVDTIKRRQGGRVYESHLVRRSVREGRRVRKETVANISGLPPEAIEAVRRVLRGETLIAPGEGLRIEGSVPHGHVAAVLGTLRRLGLERVVAPEPSRG